MTGIFSNQNNKLDGEKTTRAVLFDCDGVIANSEEIMFAAAYEYVREHGFQYTRAEYAAISIGGTGPQSYLPVLAQDFARMHGQSLPYSFGSELCNRMYGALESELVEVPGVGRLLQRLKDEGVACAVGTNAGTRPTFYKLYKLGLSEYFNDHVYSYGAQVRPKPAPDIYLAAAAGLGYAPQDCLVIDDSPSGVKAGVATGGTVIGFTGGGHRDDSHQAYADELRAAGAAHAARTMDEVESFIFSNLRIAAPRP